MSDNQSWSSSGSEEDLELDSGNPVGVVEFSGILSKVSLECDLETMVHL